MKGRTILEFVGIAATVGAFLPVVCSVPEGVPIVEAMVGSSALTTLAAVEIVALESGWAMAN